MTEDRSYFDNPDGTSRRHYSAEVICFTKYFLIDSMAVYGAAMPDPEGVRHVLPPDASPEDLGSAIRDALDKSRFIPPSHPEFSKLFKERRAEELVDAYDAELMRLAGVKTKASLYRGAKGGYVTLWPDHNEIQVHVAARRKGRYFWSNKGDPVGKRTIPADARIRELGEAYLAALAESGQVS